MTPWELEFVRRAEKAYAVMPPAQRAALERTFDRLTRNPGFVDLKRMQGTANQWRIRQGRWRVIIVFDQTRHVITVQDIDQRKDVYR